MRLPRRWVASAFAAGLILGTAGAWVAASRRETPAQPMFQQLTFRRGEISSARFSPDGETIVYSGAWEGRSEELYSTRVGSTGERALGVQGKLLAISAAGEVA